jgi:hypothetical protein
MLVDRSLILVAPKATMKTQTKRTMRAVMTSTNDWIACWLWNFATEKTPLSFKSDQSKTPGSSEPGDSGRRMKWQFEVVWFARYRILPLLFQNNLTPFVAAGGRRVDFGASLFFLLLPLP